jgi:hypothetical protein
MLSGHHLDISKIAQALSSGWLRFLILRKAAARKQGMQKQT